MTRGLFFVFVLSLAVYFIWSINTPYPLNWDLYEHQILANQINSGNLNFVTSKMSDSFTFNGYSPFFHLIIVSLQKLIPTDVMNFWYGITFFHLFMTIFASYLLTYVITQNKSIAYISAFIGAFVFESSVVYTTLFFIPQTFTALIFVFLLSRLYAKHSEGKLLSYPTLIISTIFLVLNHYIVGTVGAIIYLCNYLYLRFHNRISGWINTHPILEMTMVLFIAVAIVSSFVNFDFINYGEAKFYAFDLMDKFKFMQNAYGYLLMIFLPIGIVSSIKKNDYYLKVITFNLFCLLGLVLTQLPYVLKFYALGRYIVHLFMAVGIYVILSQITSKVFRTLSYIVLIMTLTVVFITNAAYFKSILLYKNQYSQVSKYEILASEFLKKRYSGSSVLLVSDPATQNIMEAISGINTPGGAYSKKEIRQKMDNLTKTDSTLEVRNILYDIKDGITPDANKRILVVSGRYYLWQRSNIEDKLSFYFNIWAPSDLSLNNYRQMELLDKDWEHFKLVYLNPGVGVYEVN